MKTIDVQELQEVLEGVFELPTEQLRPFAGPPGEERCGILLGHRKRGHFVIEKIIEVPNAAENPKSTFAIRRADLDHVRTSHPGAVLGVLHTHWNDPPHPSAIDVKTIPHTWLGVVYHPKSNTITYYTRAGFIAEVTPE